MVLLHPPPFQLVLVFDESFVYCGFEVVTAKKAKVLTRDKARDAVGQPL